MDRDSLIQSVSQAMQHDERVVANPGHIAPVRVAHVRAQDAVVRVAHAGAQRVLRPVELMIAERTCRKPIWLNIATTGRPKARFDAGVP